MCDPFVLQVKQFRLRTLIQVEQLAQHVSSPSLLLLAAQKESEGQQHRAAPACALADPAAVPASPAVASEVQLSCRLDHLPIYSVLIALAVLDSLTTMQKAQWLAASYPWVSPGSTRVLQWPCKPAQQMGCWQ